MTKQIYMVVGVPCSGKSWVCEQLRDRFHYVRHDDYIDRDYVNEIVRVANSTRMLPAAKPLLIETPFSMSQILEPLEKAGFNVTPVFILETREVLRDRYRAREGTPIPQGHLTRQDTYRVRASHMQAFRGTSSEVLRYLQSLSQYNTGFKWPWEKT